jgi:hypothetical protein
MPPKPTKPELPLPKPIELEKTQVMVGKHSGDPKDGVDESGKGGKKVILTDVTCASHARCI